MIAKLISGGQSGVDLAGLDAAKAMGIPTGGWMPRGWLTEDGPRPEYAERYGLQEMPTADYPSRTRMNVQAAHATLILDVVGDSVNITGGTKLTFDCAYRHGQRGAGLYLADLRRMEMVAECRAWLGECLVARPFAFTLNVAGPRESKCPGIYQRAREFLLAVLRPEGTHERL